MVSVLGLVSRCSALKQINVEGGVDPKRKQYSEQGEVDELCESQMAIQVGTGRQPLLHRLYHGLGDSPS